MVQEVQQTNRALQNENTNPFILLEDATHAALSAKEEYRFQVKVDPLKTDTGSVVGLKPYIGCEIEILYIYIISFPVKVAKELKSSLPNNFEILR